MFGKVKIDVYNTLDAEACQGERYLESTIEVENAVQLDWKVLMARVVFDAGNVDWDGNTTPADRGAWDEGEPTDNFFPCATLFGGDTSYTFSNDGAPGMIGVCETDHNILLRAPDKREDGNTNFGVISTGWKAETLVSGLAKADQTDVTWNRFDVYNMTSYTHTGKGSLSNRNHIASVTGLSVASGTYDTLKLTWTITLADDGV